MIDTQIKDNYLQNSFNNEKKSIDNVLDNAVNISPTDLKENNGCMEHYHMNDINIEIAMNEKGKTSLNDATIIDYKPNLDDGELNDI